MLHYMSFCQQAVDCSGVFCFLLQCEILLLTSYNALPLGQTDSQNWALYLLTYLLSLSLLEAPHTPSNPGPSFYFFVGHCFYCDTCMYVDLTNYIIIIINNT